VLSAFIFHIITQNRLCYNEIGMPKLSGIPRQHHKVYHQKKIGYR